MAARTSVCAARAKGKRPPLSRAALCDRQMGRYRVQSHNAQPRRVHRTQSPGGAADTHGAHLISVTDRHRNRPGSASNRTCLAGRPATDSAPVSLTQKHSFGVGKVSVRHVLTGLPMKNLQSPALFP